MATIIGKITNDTIIGSSSNDILYGGGANIDYQNGIDTLINAGVAVSGYVYSSYGTRSLLEINQDIWFMKTFYPKITSVFIDETSGLTQDLSLYKSVADYAHSLGLKVIFNVGTTPNDNNYFSYADTVVVIENPEEGASYINDAINNGVASNKIAALGYGINVDDVLEIASNNFEAGAGYVYVTEDGQNNTNPWDSLTTTFSEQIALAEQYNSKLLIPLYSYPTDPLWQTLVQAKQTAVAIINPNNGPQTGNDTIKAGGGNDTLYGYDGNDLLYGEAGRDTLYGGANADVLNGGSGNDLLYGGSGRDTFIFNTTLNATSNIDTLTDFSSADDTIKLENGIFKKLSATGVLNSAYFKANATGKAMDTNDYIVYETDTGKLFYDADGSGKGAAIQIAVIGVETHPTLTYDDFIVI